MKFRKWSLRATSLKNWRDIFMWSSILLGFWVIYGNVPQPVQTTSLPQATHALLPEGNQAEQQLTDLDPNVRILAAQSLSEDDSAHGVLLLYLIAHDPDPNVQMAGLAATLNRCKKESAMVCAEMMRFFAGDDQDLEVNWQARDWLLNDHTSWATDNASVEYKLDVVSRMGEKVQDPIVSQSVLKVLRLLADDPEPQVQEAASAMLMQSEF